MKIAALAGGVGGAKLVQGLADHLGPDRLTVIVNVGDDFDHLGLRICPDLDTVMYTLAGLANPVTGWGRADETWAFLETLEALGGPTWFRLGDRDLALHVERTRRLREGARLSQVVEQACLRLGVQHRILPASDDPIPTLVETAEGWLNFQEYFVARRCEPEVRGFRFSGAEQATPAPGVLEAIEAADSVVLCPSNPWVSLDPILAIPGLRDAIRARPVVGVSPIVGGEAVKGPAAKMFRELGIRPTAAAAAAHYAGLLQLWIIDDQDDRHRKDIESLGLRVWVTNTLMPTYDDRRRLAAELLAWLEREMVMDLK